MQSEPLTTDIVLLGGGHAHVFVLKAFGMKPMPGVRLTLIAQELAASYSGMLPGLVAGHYTLDDCQIDLVRLARFAGARLIHGAATGVDRVNKRVAIEARPPIRYDFLSIDVGITPLMDEIEGAGQHAIAVKPVSIFAPKWKALEQSALQADGPRKIVVIGGGAAGVELALAARHRFKQLASNAGFKSATLTFTLVAGGVVLPSHSAWARALASTALAAANVVVIENDLAAKLNSSGIELMSGRRIDADAVLVSTKAAAPHWFLDSKLPVDANGFLATRPTLQLLDDDDVFAVGDCAAVLEYPRPKSGVFAVRQGPVVAENFRRRAAGEAAQPFVPQRQFLSLISLGEKRAIASRGSYAASGAWAWTLKDRIDRDFMNKFTVLPVMDGEARGETSMRCGGCAAKVGPVTLANALDRLNATRGMLGTPPRDDAAIIDDGGTAVGLETVDFFRTFWPDPYLLGEIAASHALSDIFAMGGAPTHAQAIVVLPYARPEIVEEDLYQVLAGARLAFDRDGVALIGGHSSEGAELSVGFAVSGAAKRTALMRKNGLQPGDKLIMSKPLGTGILFAAEMRGLVKAGSIQAALAGMRQSNRTAAECFARHGAKAMTDVTGFGLAGHLIEMLDGSGVEASLNLAALPCYPQVIALAAAGVASSLLPENSVLAGRLKGEVPLSAATLALLFDPQTSGGLVAGVPSGMAQACLEDFHKSGMQEAAIIGDVVPSVSSDLVQLSVRGRLCD